MTKKSPCQEKWFCDRMMFVDVSVLSKNSIKIRGKNSSFAIDPEVKIQKVSADAVFFLKETGDESGVSRVTDFRVIIKGCGEYEVGGVRILITKSDGNFLYSLSVDGISILLARTSGLSKIQEAGEYNILVLNVDSDFKDPMVTSFSPSAVVLYGEKAADAVAGLGKTASKSQKFSVSSDKLPLEMQVVLLEQ